MATRHSDDDEDNDGTVSSQNSKLNDIKLRVSNPRTIAYVYFNMPFESSNFPGPFLQIGLLTTGRSIAESRAWRPIFRERKMALNGGAHRPRCHSLFKLTLGMLRLYPEAQIIWCRTPCAIPAAYARFSNEDPAKSGLESKRILNVEGGFSQSAV